MLFDLIDHNRTSPIALGINDWEKTPMENLNEIGDNLNHKKRTKHQNDQ